MTENCQGRVAVEKNGSACAIRRTHASEKEQKMITSKVKDGRIERVKEHTMLGTWFTEESGEYDVNIGKRKENLNYMIATVKNQGHPKKVGVYAVETRLKLAGIVVIPSILHHVEAFPYHTEKEIQKHLFACLPKPSY